MVREEVVEGVASCREGMHAGAAFCFAQAAVFALQLPTPDRHSLTIRNLPKLLKINGRPRVRSTQIHLRQRTGILGLAIAG